MGKSVPMTAIRRIALELCRALVFLRRVRLVHADLKTENILLGRPDMSLEDSDLTIRLVDFGGYVCTCRGRYVVCTDARALRAVIQRERCAWGAAAMALSTHRDSCSCLEQKDNDVTTCQLLMEIACVVL
jgi:hypothetical protein